MEKIKERIHLIDEARGLAVFCMVFYHAFYAFYYIFESQTAESLFNFFMPVEPLFAGLFIFLCGISCSFSRNNFKRGIKLLGIAAVISLVTCIIMPKLGFSECEIFFGIIHFLSCAILIFCLFQKPASIIDPIFGIMLCIILYPFFSGVSKGFLNYGELFSLKIPPVLYQNNYLFPLGIYSNTFYSMDYFPIFPDIFIFFAGVFSGKFFVKNGFPRWSYPSRIPFFSFLGRHALVIYVVHMPVVFGLAYAAQYLFK